MKFGYVENPGEVDYTLPKDHSLTDKLFSSTSKVEPKFYIGCPVWSEKAYVGKIYPPQTRANHYLAEYCKQFNCIEVNATRYGTPKVSTVENWKIAASQVEHFKFSPKFPQYISHRRNIADDDSIRDTDQFIETMNILGNNLGMSFLQLPPHFGPSRFAELERFLSHLPADFSLSIEVRHPDIFGDEIAISDFHSLLQGFGVSWIITDVSGRRDVIHQALTSTELFIRYTGNKLHPTDFVRIDGWVERISEWIEKGLETVYFYMHQPAPYKYLSADLAGYMIEKFNTKLGLSIKAPVRLDK